MKVCFFNRSYWPDQAATGQLLTELAEDLVSRHGCSVSVVAGDALHAAESSTSASISETGASRRSTGGGWLVRDEVHNGVTIRRARSFRRSRRRFAGRAANYLSYFASASVAAAGIGRQDVIVALTDPPIIGLAALWAARRSGARFVFLCEDIFPEVGALVADFHSAAVDRALDRTNRYLLTHADAIVALGDRMRQRLVAEKGADPARTHVIHNWADCDLIKPGPKQNPFSRRHDLADRFVVMHSGNVGLSQNLDVLIEAADRLRSKERLTFAIVGDGARRDALARMAAARGLTNVVFLPYQPKESLAESFAAADVFVVSLEAGLEGYIVPSKVYGILAAGRPYVAAADSSCEAAAIARDSRCGIVAPPDDPDRLAAAIASLYDDPASAAAMGARARQAAWQFDRRAAVDAYHQLLVRVAGVAQAA